MGFQQVSAVDRRIVRRTARHEPHMSTLAGQRPQLVGVLAQIVEGPLHSGRLLGDLTGHDRRRHGGALLSKRVAVYRDWTVQGDEEALYERSGARCTIVDLRTGLR